MKQAVSKPRPAQIVALAFLAGTSLLSFGRTFIGWSWLIPVLGAAGLSMIATRGFLALGLGRVTAAAAAAFTGVWFTVLVIFPENTFYGVPTLRALSKAVSTAIEAWNQSQKVIAPLAPLAGYLMLLMAAAWAAGCISTVLLRRGNSLTAALPWLGCFAYASAVGTPSNRRLYLLLTLTALMVFMFADAWSQAFLSVSKSIGKRTHALKLKVSQSAYTAGQIGALSLIGALIVPVLLPGYGQGAIVRLGADVPGTGKVILSPFSALGPRLKGPRRTMFKVTADKPSYWRLTSLDYFDGSSWRISGRFQEMKGIVPVSEPLRTSTIALGQKFQIEGLGGNWLPAAYAPALVKGIEAIADPTKATLLVDDLRPKQTYEVISLVPIPTVESLNRGAERTGVEPKLLYLPQNLPSGIFSLTQRIALGAGSPYEQALAIQAYLRGFEYSENVAAGHSAEYLNRFLLERLPGYCEQFASAMALMLRARGIPSRVAVGFLPGTRKGNTFTVTTEEAHAWPEGYFFGVGWIPFEPTPRSGANPPSYTLPSVRSTGSTSPDASIGETAPPADSSNQRELEILKEASSPSAHTRTSAIAIARNASARIALAFSVMLFLLAFGRLARIRLPGLLARSTRRLVTASFEEFQLRTAETFRSRKPSETELEYAESACNELDIPLQEAVLLASVFQRGQYAQEGVSEKDRAIATRSLARLRRTLWRKSGWWGKVRLLFSPLPLIHDLSRLARAGVTRRSVNSLRKRNVELS